MEPQELPIPIVRLRHELRNQRDELVLVMEHPFIVKARTEAAA